MSAALNRTALADCPPQPWKNRGGSTRELLAWPHAADWALRLSVASIDRDGPFSGFPAIERWFAVIDGPGVELRWPGLTRVLRPGDAPLRFDGGEAPDCHLLDGPTTDINLMVRRQTGRGMLRRAVPGLAWDDKAAWRGFFAARAARLDIGRAPPLAVPAGTLVWCASAEPGPWRVDAETPEGRPSGLGWWIRFEAQLPNAGAPA
jgi:hypothetical protein